MNIFMPEETIVESVRALDDRRLIKQILECKTILDVAIEGKSGYAKHPVVVYYKNYPWFVCRYGITACAEYCLRFDKLHGLARYFEERAYDIPVGERAPMVFYCEGTKGSPNAIRTTDNTVELFREKLCGKWDRDKYAPKWTGRERPGWYDRRRGKDEVSSWEVR